MMAQNTLDFRAHLPLEYKIEPVSNHSHPYHLGAHVVTEVEPEGEVEAENITRVSNGGHEVEEVVVFSVVALQVLYDQHPAAVDQVHLVLEVCECQVLVDASSASVKAQQTPSLPPFIARSGLIDHSVLPWQQSEALKGNQVMCFQGVRGQHFKRFYKKCFHRGRVTVRCFTGHCFMQSLHISH